MAEKKIIVLGFGCSGKAVANLAHILGYHVTIIDDNSTPQQIDDRIQYESCGIEVILDRLSHHAPVPECDLIITSPGISKESALLKDALSTNKPVISELEFGYQHCQTPIIAITGTNGKTTTTELTTDVLQSLGLKAVSAGNIGTPLCEFVNNLIKQPEEIDFLVVEVSSFQLEFCTTFKPAAAVLLNITPDHLDRHTDLAEYSRIKFKLFKNIDKPENIVLNSVLLPDWIKHTRNQEDIIRSAGIPVIFESTACSLKTSDTDDKPDFIFDEKSGIVSFLYQNKYVPLIDMTKTQFSGLHGAENLMAVCGIVKVIHGDAILLSLANNENESADFSNAICKFKIGEHRLETIMEHNDILFINDSKSTNPASTVAAINSLEKTRRACLILGGLDKNMDFSAIIEVAIKIKTAFVYGQAREKILAVLKDIVDCHSCESFEEAVNSACDTATPGDVVLLSPGCASMDLFKNYQERGKRFRELILAKIQSSEPVAKV